MLTSKTKYTVYEMVKFLCTACFLLQSFFAHVPTMPIKKNPGATTGTVTTTTTNTSVAEQKRSDVTVQGLKGKVQIMSESFLAVEGPKKVLSKNVFKYDANGSR
jgi:hypothetical protein